MKNNFNNEIKVPKDKAISLLNNLIGIPSIKGKKNDAIIDFLKRELEELDCHPEVYIADSDKFLDYPEYCPFSEGTEKKQKYISGIIKGSGGGKSILIFSHLDTEDIVDRDLWDTDPLKLVKKGDRLYGLGSADAKSGVAACLIALRVIKEMGIKLKGDVKFIGENEKDMGSTGPLAVFTKGCNVDGALYIHASETGNGVGELKIATDGVLTFRVTVFGEKPPLREEGNPQNYINIKDGVNAIDKAIKIIEALKVFAKKRDQQFNKDTEKTTFNLGVIKGGEAPGVLADNCAIEGNIIFSTKETVDSIYKEIENIIQKVIAEDNQLKKCPPRLEKIALRGNPASLTSLGKGKDILQVVKEVVEVEDGCKFSTYVHHQASAIRFPMIYDQLPTVAFGSLCDNFYKPNEWVSQEEYIKSIRILVNAIIKWCG